MTARSKPRLFVAAWGLPLCVAAVGWCVTGCCGPSLEDVIAKHKAAIDAKVAPLPKIREQVAQLPPLQSDTVTHTGAPLVVALASTGAPTDNAMLTYAEDLQSAEELGYVWGRLEHTGELNQCAAIAHLQHEAFDPAKPDELLGRPLGFTAESLLERCERTSWLLVIRTLEFVQPSTPEPAGSAFAPDPSVCDPSASAVNAADAADAYVPASGEVRLRFEGGSIRAEVLVFSLGDARFEGGFRVETSSSARVKGASSSSDLRDKLRAAVLDGIKTHIQGATVHL